MADSRSVCPSSPTHEWSETDFRHAEREILRDKHLNHPQCLLKRIRLQLTFVFSLRLRHREEAEQTLLR
jgi:hypothetical protein